MMESMEEYMRALDMIGNLKANLENLYDHRISLLNQILRVEKQIDKHESFLKQLEQEIME